ncbi:hypothetical protein ACHQM5_009048 [Ranunculus cassubicifolius]
MQLVSGSNLFMVMRAALELDLFEIIAKAGSGVQISAKEIVSHLPTNNPNAANMLDRVLGLLSTHSILTSSVTVHENGQPERFYGLTPRGRYFVENEDGVSLAPSLLLNLDKALTESWYNVKDAILEGDLAFNRAHGMPVSEYTKINSRFSQTLSKAMHSYTAIYAKKMVETYKGFKDLREVLDVGGGLGVTIGIITEKYPNIKAINFDLPHVIRTAAATPGVENVAGDMFESIPNSETIFMKWILHDWDDEHCLKLLKNCYKALPSEGKVIVVDGILPGEADTSVGAKVACERDVNMLAHIGVKERTEFELDKLAKGAGFGGMKKVCSVYSYWVMEFYKV